MSTISFIWPLLSFWWTTVLLRQLWKKCLPCCRRLRRLRRHRHQRRRHSNSRSSNRGGQNICTSILLDIRRGDDVSALSFTWPLLSFWWTTVLLRQLCKKKPCCRRLRRLRRHRHHRRRCLLCCCCCAAAVVTYGYLFSVLLKKYSV